MSLEELNRWLGRCDVFPPEAAAILRSVTRTKNVEVVEGEDETRMQALLGAKSAKAELPKAITLTWRPFTECVHEATMIFELEVVSKDPKEPLRFRLWKDPTVYSAELSDVLCKWLILSFPRSAIYKGSFSETDYMVTNIPGQAPCTVVVEVNAQPSKTPEPADETPDF
ncbi:MAG: hypothetical protein HC923_12960 [Myxococcales bacterium]|nr:hypothetical protein [Myxococcales bacterium]